MKSKGSGLSIRAKLSALFGVVVVGITVFGATSYVSEVAIISDLDAVSRVQLPAIHKMTLTDMMHDGLRAVVLRAIVGALTASDEERNGAKEELAEFSENIRGYLVEIDGLALPVATKTAIAAAKPDVEAYVKSAEEIVAIAISSGSEAALARMPQFQESFEKLEGSLGALGELIEQDVISFTKLSEERATWYEMLTAVVFGVTLCVFALFSFLIGRSIIRPLSMVMDGIRECTDQLGLSANQVATNGQSLAQGATEQAASLEETAQTLDHIGSMSEQNSDNSAQASELAVQVQKASEGGVDSMKRMQDAIESIKQASEETAEIIRTIDEIAFQTNLLALNAAVEAARAGDAGRGFAVVAEEVRSLAQRSSVAAKDTTERIRRAKELAENGVRVSNEVAGCF